jgi:hypothetical protein
LDVIEVAILMTLTLLPHMLGVTSTIDDLCNSITKNLLNLSWSGLRSLLIKEVF